MKTITVDEFLQFNPCYPESRIRAIAATHDGKTEWSALDILALEDIPATDRLWAVLYERLIDAPILHEVACRYAERALARVENPDPRSVAAVETKRRWLRGEATNEELSAARNAARSAVQAVAEYAADYVAEYAVRSTTWSAAEDAAWNASRSDARSTTWSAAEYAAEHEAQIDILREMLKTEAQREVTKS
jgi:hypothetical protein